MVQRQLCVEVTYEDSAHHFFVIKGIVHFEFIPQGQRVSQAYYLEIWKQLYEVVHRKGLKFGPTM
jgi:hypothetical protein